MAFVVLFSTLSLTIDMHYCGGTLVDTAIFHKAKSCGMELQKASITKDCSVVKKNCCNDEQILVDGQDELQISVDKLTFEQHVFIASFVYTYQALFEGIEDTVNSYIDYAPPLVVRELYKLDETYLI